MSDNQETVGAELAWANIPGRVGAGSRSTMGHPGETEPPLGAGLTCPCRQQSLATADALSGSVHCDKCGNSFRLEQMRQDATIDEIRVIGRFQLLDRVGKGSFGTVWRARDTQLDRIVALKVPHPYVLASGLDTDRVGREARVAAQLRHSGIVRRRLADFRGPLGPDAPRHGTGGQ